MTVNLNNALILVTRPEAQAEPLCQLIRQHQGQVLKFPVLEILPIPIDSLVLENALDSDYLIFTSVNAVDFALGALSGKMSDLQTKPLAAVGQTTAKALHNAGLKVTCVPEKEFSSEGLLAHPAMQQVSGKRLTIVRGVGGREKLATTLRQRGASVDYLEVYRRCQAKTDNSELVQHLRNGKLHIITITSSEALQNLLAMLDKQSAVLLQQLPLIVVSDRIKQLAQQLGFSRVISSQQATDTAIFDTLTTLLSGGNSGRSN